MVSQTRDLSLERVGGRPTKKPSAGGCDAPALVPCHAGAECCAEDTQKLKGV